MEKSLAQLKHIEQISRQTRHHRTYLNQVCDQKLQRELNHLANECGQTFIRSATQRKLEEQRKQLLDVTVKHIVRERQYHSLPRNSTQIEQTTIQALPKNDKEDLQSPPASSSIKLPPVETSCRLFSHECQLYPCQPIYHYTSFIKKDHDQTLRERNPSTKNSDPNSTSSSHLEELLHNVEEKKYQQNRRQLAVTVHNQRYLANRHVFMERTMARLDEQSRLLHEQLANKKTFGYVKERQHDLKQAMQRHLELSAKFCA